VIQPTRDYCFSVFDQTRMWGVFPLKGGKNGDGKQMLDKVKIYSI